jgi:hypothetical protein
MGYYQNWEKKSIYITPSLQWYHVDTLVNYLHETRCCLINKNPFIQWPKSVPTPLATQRVRFPDNISYMCEGIGNWHVQLDLLLLSLNIISNPKRIETSEFKSIGQVEMYAFEKINSLLQSIVQVENLITRERFEKVFFELNWIEKEEQENYLLFLGWKLLLDDKNKIVSFVINGLLHRVDKIWHKN